MIDHVFEMGLMERPYGQAEVGGSAVYLMSDLSKGVTGQIIYIDNGYNVAAL
jgi:enoyl-[acyl-carrier protein] reductase I